MQMIDELILNIYLYSQLKFNFFPMQSNLPKHDMIV